MTLAPQKKLLLSGSWDKTIKVWNMDNYTELPKNIIAHEDYIYALAINNAETTLFSGSWDKNIKIWDIENNYKLLHTIDAM